MINVKRVRSVLLLSGAMLASLSLHAEPCLERPLPAIGEAAFVGVAKDLQTDQLRYREFHFKEQNDDRHRVLYIAADGELMAEKCLRYDASNIQPQVHQYNHRSGELIVIDPQSDDGLGFRYRETSAGAVKTHTVTKPEQLVVDAGFDAFVQQQWQNLQAGENPVFDYAVPSRLTAYPFRLQTKRCEEEVATAEPTCFRIAPKAWWLRMLVDSIGLVYDDQQRLQSYRGLGNIGDAEGDYLRVAIRYYYPEEKGYAEHTGYSE